MKMATTCFSMLRYLTVCHWLGCFSENLEHVEVNTHCQHEAV